MIKFNANNKLEWKHLDPELAQTYIQFLIQELARHQVELSISDGKSLEALPDKKLLSQLWRSAHARHAKDIVDGEKLIRDVKEYFGL